MKIVDKRIKNMIVCGLAWIDYPFVGYFAGGKVNENKKIYFLEFLNEYADMSELLELIEKNMNKFFNIDNNSRNKQEVLIVTDTKDLDKKTVNENYKELRKMPEFGILQKKYGLCFIDAPVKKKDQLLAKFKSVKDYFRCPKYPEIIQSLTDYMSNTEKYGAWQGRELVKSILYVTAALADYGFEYIEIKGNPICL